MSLADQYIYRRYQDGDEEDILKLLQEVFEDWGADQRSSPIDYWKWKYLDNPYQKQENIEKPIVIVCEHNNKIIGIVGTFLVRIKIGDKMSLISIGSDGAVKVNHRGKGILSRSMRMRGKELASIGVEFNINTTHNPFLLAKYKREGYILFPHKIATYVKINDINEHMRHVNYDSSLNLKYGYIVSSTLLRLVNLTKKKPEKTYKVETWERFDESADIFWNKIKSKYLFILERKRDYLNWKYCDPRIRKYTIRGIKREGEIIGFSVLTIQEDDDYLTGIVEDLVVDLDGIEVVESLLVDAVDFFDEMSVNLVSMRVVKGHPFSEVLGRCGFVDSRRRQIVSFNHILDVSEHFHLFMISKPDQVHWIHGDMDS